MTETWTLLFSLLSLRATLLVSELLVAAKVHDFVLFTQSSLFVGFRCYLIGMFFYAHALCLRFRALLFCEFQIGRLSILLSWIRLWINGEVYPSSFNSSTETQEYEFHGNRCPSVLYQSHKGHGFKSCSKPKNLFRYFFPVVLWLHLHLSSFLHLIATFGHLLLQNLFVFVNIHHVNTFESFYCS